MKIVPGAYVIVRADRAGVFAGTLVARDGDTVTLAEVRRLWRWAGAASLSELAQRGSSCPDKCRFPIEVSEELIFGAIEILAVTDAARASIKEVPVWTR